MYCVKHTQNVTGAGLDLGAFPPPHHRLNLGAVLTERYSCKAHSDRLFGQDISQRGYCFVQGHHK